MSYFDLDRDIARLILLQRTEIITPKLKNLRKIFGRYFFTNFLSNYLISPKSISVKYYEVMHQEMNQLKTHLNFENKNYFYWMSSSAFKYAITKYPNIQNKFHFCGPGNTYNEIKKILGDDSRNLTVELSYKDWKNNILSSIE